MPTELLDTEGLAAQLHTTERHIRELRYRRTIPAIKVGRLIRYDLDEVLTALRERSAAA